MQGHMPELQSGQRGTLDIKGVWRVKKERKKERKLVEAG